MYTPIKLDKTRNLRYGMRAIDRVENELGKPIFQIDMANLYMKDMATIIWAGLVHEDTELTIDKTIDIIDDSKLPVTEIFEIASKTLTKAFTGNEEVEEAKN